MVKVDKFIFDLDGKKLELTEKECMQLKDKLNELFQLIQYYPVYPYAPAYPWYTTTGDKLKIQQWETTC